MIIYDRWIQYDIYIYKYGDDDDDDGDDDDDDDDDDYDYDYDYDDDGDELTWRDNCIWVGYAFLKPTDLRIFYQISLNARR